MTATHDRPSQIIIAGYLITALGALWNLVDLGKNGALSESTRFDVEFFGSTLATFATLGGWWFLSQLRAGNERQRVIVRRGFCLLALSLILNTLGIAAFTVSVRLSQVHLGYYVVDWSRPVGGAVAAVGFLLAAAHLRPAGGASSDVPTDG